MLGVTLFGLLLTPVFYVICRRLSLGRQPVTAGRATSATETPVPIIASPDGDVHS